MTAVSGVAPMPVRGARLTRRFLRASRLNRLGGVIVTVVVLLAVAGLVADALGVRFTPYDPAVPVLAERLQPPSTGHPMGTDHLGRDILSRVLAGAHVAVEVAVIVLVLAVVIGVVTGLLAGLAGGIVDEVLMRVTDLFLAFPALILAAAITFTLGANLQTTMLALAMVYWPWYARIARGHALRLRSEEFVVAARTIGASRVRLVFVTMLPNVAPFLLVQATLDMGYVMLSTAGLSFLGLGAQPPVAEWGSMILSSLPYQPDAWWYSAFPGLVLAVSALGFNLVGDGLRDWLDPVTRPGDESAVV